MKSRGYDQKGLKGLKPIAYASGALLIRGYERGERVYNSMISRGFNGSIELKKREFKKLGRRDRGVKQAGFVVLYRTTMPSVLIETGFLTKNNQPLKLLKMEKDMKENG